VYLVSTALYLGVSIAIWWGVWSTHPTSTTTCGCGDPSLFTWFLEWPAYAISHGASLFYSTRLFHPGGINLLANTSVLAIGVPLAPVTWLFGPVATLNVASTLVPVVNGLAALWLIRRWVSWQPAAFVGGLLYGFSPFVLSNLAVAHLMTAALALFPIMVGCLDELLVRQRYRPGVVGGVLGAAMVLEFFVSTEMLVVAAMSAAVGMVLLVGNRLVADRSDIGRRAGHALRGLAVAAGVSVVLLAYPTWYALAGPAHLSGRIWPNIPVIGGYIPSAFVNATYGTQRSILRDIGGYLGRPLPSSAYVGWGMLAVLALGMLAWRRDRRLWFFGALGVVAAALSLGERRGHWVPWQLFDRVPVLDNVVEQRFTAVAYLAIAVMLAVILDHARRLTLSETRGAPARLAVPAASVVVALVVALGPLVAAFAPLLPYEVRPVSLPAWYAIEGPRIRTSAVLLAYPAPFSGIQSSMTWQAVNRLRYSQAGGGGPQGTPGRAGRERAGFLVLSELGFGFTPPPTGTPAQFAAVRTALRGWRVTTVVVPDRTGVAFVVGHDPHYAVAFLTAALGITPRFEYGAWVWDPVDLRRPPCA